MKIMENIIKWLLSKSDSKTVHGFAMKINELCRQELESRLSTNPNHYKK